MDTQLQELTTSDWNRIQCWHTRAFSGWFGKLHVPSELAASMRGLTTGLDWSEDADDVARGLVCV